MPRLSDKIRELINLSPEKKQEWEIKAKQKDPAGYKNFLRYLEANPGAPLESLGYEPWLRRLGPYTFTRPFAPIQRRFWEWNWEALQKVKENESLLPREKVGFLPWPRETGKCLARGTEILKEDGVRVPIEL